VSAAAVEPVDCEDGVADSVGSEGRYVVVVGNSSSVSGVVGPSVGIGLVEAGPAVVVGMCRVVPAEPPDVVDDAEGLPWLSVLPAPAGLVVVAPPTELLVVAPPAELLVVAPPAELLVVAPPAELLVVAPPAGLLGPRPSSVFAQPATRTTATATTRMRSLTLLHFQ
jgi:hypothetical protein